MINPYLAVLFAPYFLAIGVTTWRYTWRSTIDGHEGLVKPGCLRELFLGVGATFLGGSYLYYTPSYPGPAILYGALGGGMIVIVATAYLAARIVIGRSAKLRFNANR